MDHVVRTPPPAHAALASEEWRSKVRALGDRPELAPDVALEGRPGARQRQIELAAPALEVLGELSRRPLEDGVAGAFLRERVVRRQPRADERVAIGDEHDRADGGGDGPLDHVESFPEVHRWITAYERQGRQASALRCACLGPSPSALRRPRSEAGNASGWPSARIDR